jgi:hypothetical protein
LLTAVLAAIGIIIAIAIYVRLGELHQLSAMFFAEVSKRWALPTPSESAEAEEIHRSVPVGGLRNLEDLRTAFAAAESPRVWQIPEKRKKE